MKINIRSAKENDSSFLAEMMLQSSRADKKLGFFDYLFSTDDDKKILSYLEKLTKTKAKSYCHYKNFLVAEADGKNIGTLCSYEPRISTKEKFIEALKEIGCNDDVIISRLDRFVECDFDINKRTLMFDFLEEVEGYVDVGILKALMQKALLNARLKGYRVAQTLVEIGSLETLLFYEQLGFKEKEEKECEFYKEQFGRRGLKLLELVF